MRNKLIQLLALVFIGTTTAFAQLNQPNRFEEVVEPSDDGFTVISLKKEGLALIRDRNKFDGGKKKWQLEIVDTTLTKIWSTDLELDQRMILVGYEYNPKHLYLLFREGDNEFHSFEILTIAFYEKTVLTDKVKFELSFKLTHFTMAGTSAVFGGYINNEPAVLLYNQSSDHPKVLPGLFNKDISLLDVRTNQNQSFNVLLTERKAKERKRLILRTFDPEGNLLIDDIIEIEPQFSILAALTSSLERDEMMIAGTYGEGSSRQALGFFSVIVDPFNEQPVTYTDFCSLNHFLDYMGPKRATKIKTKAQKERASGQMPDYRAYVVPLRIEEHQNGFYLLAESYYPSDNSQPYAYGNSFYNPYSYGYYPYGMSPFSSRYYNSPYMSNNPVRSSSVQMTQSLVIKLGTQGKAEKDISLKLDDVRQPSIEQVGDFTVANDSIVLMYKKEDDIIFQKEPADPDAEPVTQTIKVQLKESSDELKDSDEDAGMIRFWYDHHFYIWGYQRVKDPSRANDQTRYVFYVNRATLE